MTLELNNISKRLGNFELSDFSLSVKEGEYFVILGPSGVGKSVLLETIAGILSPDSGKIQWKGKDLTNSAPELRPFAIVYQDYALFPHLTVRENIAYGPKARRLGKREEEKRVSFAAGLAGIECFLGRMPGSLSGGEAQRTALARALAVTPELLLLDEPLSAVDMRLRRTLRRELKMIQKKTGGTFLHVTHDVDEAMELGDRIGVMLDGELRTTGKPDEVFHSPKDLDVANFMGMRNIISVKCGEDGYCSAGALRIHVGERAEEYGHIWIRPEEIILSKERFHSSARNQILCKIEDWSLTKVLVAVRLLVDETPLTAMITFASFREMGIAQGDAIHATFKSSSVHCF